MKIILDSSTPGFGGDLMSLDRLLRLLEEYNKVPERNPHIQATTNQWIVYLTNLLNKVQRANWEGSDISKEFEFPFDKEFTKFLALDLAEKGES